MLAFELLAWWYSRGWQQAAENARRRVLNVSQMFSLPILLRTMFAPWKRIISYPGAGLDAHLHAMFDNLFSRAVGFVVRLMVLLAALIIFLVMGVVGLLQILAWPLVPPATIFFLIGAALGGTA